MHIIDMENSNGGMLVIRNDKILGGMFGNQKVSSPNQVMCLVNQEVSLLNQAVYLVNWKLSLPNQAIYLVN